MSHAIKAHAHHSLSYNLNNQRDIQVPYRASFDSSSIGKRSLDLPRHLSQRAISRTQLDLTILKTLQLPTHLTLSSDVYAWRQSYLLGWHMIEYQTLGDMQELALFYSEILLGMLNQILKVL